MSNLKAIISADTSGFKKSVEEATKILELYSDTLNKAVKANREASGVTDEQINSYNRVVKQLLKVNSGTMTLTQQEKSLKNQIAELKAQWANLNETTKKSDFGKSISNSARTAEALLKQLLAQMKSVKESSNDTGSKVSKLSVNFSSVASSLKGLGTAFLAVSTAQEAFMGVIRGSLATSDTFDLTLKVLKTSVGNFFTAISTGDFSSFNRGLDGMISRAKEAYTAVDQLGNFLMSYDVINAKAQRQITKAKAVLLDPKSTKELKELAKKDLQSAYKEIGDAAKQGVEDYNETIRTEIAAQSNIDVSGDDVSGVINKFLTLDASKDRDKIKAYYKQLYDEYRKGSDDLKKLNVSTTFVQGAPVTRYNTNSEDYKKKLQELNDQYKDAIIYHTMLEKLTDDELKNLGQQYIQMINMDGAAEDFFVQMQKVNNRIDKSNGGGTTTPKQTNIELTPEWKEHSLQVAALTVADTVQEALNRNEFDIAIKAKVDLSSGPLDLEDYEGAEIENDAAIEMYLKMKEESEKYNESLTAGYEGLQSMIGATESLYESFESLGENWEDMNFAERFFAITDAIFGTIDAINSFSEGAKSMISMIKSISAASSAASKKKIADNTAEQVSNETTQATELGKAASGIFSAHSSIPWVGVAVAIAMIGLMMAAMASFHNGGIVGKYANGGIIPKYAGGGMISAPQSLGDMNIARVNSGEMILNGSQLKKLFNMLNGSSTSDGVSGGQVEFKISGDTLYGVLKNHSKINATVGKNIGLS